MSDLDVFAQIINVMSPILTTIIAIGYTPQSALSMLIILPASLYIAAMYAVFKMTMEPIRQYYGRALSPDEKITLFALHRDQLVLFAYANVCTTIIAIISQIVGAVAMSWSYFAINMGTLSVGFIIIVLGFIAAIVIKIA